MSTLIMITSSAGRNRQKCVELSVNLAVKRYKDKLHQRTGHNGPGVEVQALLYSFFNLGTRSGWVVNSTPRLLYPWE